ncbi:MAG: MoaD/ThiS family protein [Armatimonadota bacterium]|nr:MoaD/ThiS family protein [Armatimonadota bacterium]
MQVQVYFFASHRDAAGMDEMDLVAPDGSDVQQAAALLVERFPRLQPLLPSARAAVNEEYCSRDQVLRDGDRLVFIPPVSGG